jgi:putative component of toxin-antitoxin plasmid stabilization module
VKHKGNGDWDQDMDGQDNQRHRKWWETLKGLQAPWKRRDISSRKRKINTPLLGDMLSASDNLKESRVDG